ncbi:DUF1266 domain-containing protein [Salinibius halmophilus]|uniref:DUF1266 domain-containing protein n=1 Tax=Salinibius halmophilus TaxID=1853216 RepID=UPI000E665016|nr:DUF1266 domain-containing protein [Salinibius halmophilus]
MSDQLTWAIGLGAVLASQNNTPYNQLLSEENDNDLTGTKQSLKRDWGIESGDDYFETYQWLIDSGHTDSYWQYCHRLRTMTDTRARAFISRFDANDQAKFELVLNYRHRLAQGGIKAWDIGRASWLTQCAHRCGWISSEVATQQHLKLASLAKPLYRSWQEYATAYVAGRQFWRADTSEGFVDECTAYIRRAFASPQCAWHSMAWV